MFAPLPSFGVALTACLILAPVARATAPESDAPGQLEDEVVQRAPQEARPGLVLGGGGVLIPINGGDVAGVLQLGVAFPLKGSDWDVRVLLDGYCAFDRNTIVRGLLLSVRATHWWGLYGFGFGVGGGAADFTDRTGHGWGDGAISLGGYLMPVVLLVGSRPRLEVGLQMGVQDYVAHDIKPYFYLSLALVL
jgi:hypothetical protein